MTITTDIIGNGTTSTPRRVDLPYEYIETWTDNGDGTATVTLTAAAKTRLELTRRAVKENDADAFLKAAELSEGEIGVLVGQMSEVTPWEDIPAGDTITAGDLVSYDGVSLYRALQTHDKQATYKPPSVPALFVEEAPAGVIPQWTQPAGAHDAYPQGSLVTHSGTVWEADVDANVWEPPTQWTERTDL